MASSAPNNNNDNTNNDSDAAISQFLAFTGASDPSVARQYLEMSGNHVETAVGLFMDHGAGGLGGGGVGGGGGAGALGGGGGTGGLGGGGGGLGAFGGAPPEVRAPDATRTMRLVGGPPSPGAGGPPFPGGGMGGGMGGFGMRGMDDDDGQPPAALVAAMGGPAAREMLRGMAMAGGMDNGDAVMGGTWAAAGAPSMGGGGGGGDTARMGSGSSSRRSRSGSGASGGNARRNSGGRRGSNDNADNNNNNHNYVGAGGGAQAMDEDDHDNGEDNDSHEYNYDDDSDDDSHDLGDGSPGHGAAAARRVPTHPPSLTTMFAPPTHLMHRAGGFLGARNFAKDARRWLLVNVQTEDDFACHALNRDVWRDELVENLVREGFVLWQTTNATNEGQTYIARYKVQGYPHLAILDPRTGSLLWRKEGWTQVHPLTAEQFVEIASDFCSRHSFDKLPMAARSAYLGGVPPGAAAAASDGGGGGRSAAGGGNKRPLAELTEEEQLQAAIRASMAENAGGGSGDEADGTDGGGAVVTDGGEDIGKKPSSDNNDAAAVDDDDEPKPSAFEREILSMEVADEPPTGPGTARVQIRMPDGKRLVRRFAGDDPVKAIYAFVAHSNEEARGGRAFELKAKFPPQDLLPMAGDGIAATGLNGEAINVMWK